MLRLKALDGYSLMEMVMVIALGSIAMPAITSMFTTVLQKSHHAEFYTVAALLAAEQIETIQADAAGAGAGFGYANINTALYAAVNPAAPFNSFTRDVQITLVDAGLANEYKRIRVRVTHPLIWTVTFKSTISDYYALP